MFVTKLFLFQAKHPQQKYVSILKRQQHIEPKVPPKIIH